MLLCDRLHRTAALRSDPGRLGLGQAPADPLVAMYLDIAEKVGRAAAAALPVVLGGDVVAAAAEILGSRPSLIRERIAGLRLPWRSAFVEWSEPSRIGAREAVGISRDNGKPVPDRSGFLVSADDGGRSGTVRFAWRHRPGAGLPDVPTVSPVVCVFDFGLAASPGRHGGPALTDGQKRRSSLYSRWSSSPGELAALDAINRCCWFSDVPDARRLAAATAARAGGGLPAADQVLQSFLDDVDGEGVSFLSVVILLTDPETVEAVPGESRERLNRARARRGELPLMDYMAARLRSPS